jgi:hypothetical protein
LDYFLARYYWSSHGRFTSIDPGNAGAANDDPQSWNGFAYVRSSPGVFVDPNGLKYVLWLPDTGYSLIDDWLFRQERKRYQGEGFTFTGDGKFFESGSILDPGGQFVGSYEQISIDDNVERFGLAMARRASASKKLIVGFAVGTAVVGATGGAALYVSGTVAGSGLTTLGLKTYSHLSSGALNQLMGNTQREILKQFLGKGVEGAKARLADFKIPAGLTKETLEIYREIALRVLRAGKNTTGSQAVRLKLIEKALEAMK